MQYSQNEGFGKSKNGMIMRTSYCQQEMGDISDETCNLQWEDCNEKIDVVALTSKEPILFYDEVGT